MNWRSRWWWLVMLAVVAGAGSFLVVHFVGSSALPEGAIVVPRDVPTLGEALERASEGSTIVLQRGADAYPGPIVLDVPGVTLSGACCGVALDGIGEEPAIAIEADGVTIENLAITAGSLGVRVSADDCRLEGLTVDAAPVGIQLSGARRCVVRDVAIDGGRVGVELVSADRNRIENLEIRDPAEVGLRLLQSNGNMIEAVTVGRAGIGIAVEQASSENAIRDGTIEGCSEAGISIRGSAGNRLEESDIAGSAVGIALDAVTGVTVWRCTVERSTTIGLSLRQSAQNRVLESRIVESGADGILLAQSHENAISYNEVTASGENGIRVDASDRNLISENRWTASGGGITLIASDGNRILRNAVEQIDGIGIALEGGRGNRLLDNGVIDTPVGIALVGATESVLVRNRCERQTAGGIALSVGTSSTALTENVVEGGGFGILLVGGDRELVSANRFSACDVGLLLIRPGPAVRIEGNRLEGNGVGLAVASTDEETASRLGALGIAAAPPDGEASTPVLAGNTFADNETDISNETDVPVYAAGNWWTDPEGAATEGRVLLRESAWKGTIAVGCERDGARVILGRILQLSLEAAGYRVIDLVGIEGGERAVEALHARDVDAVWWGTEAAVALDDQETRAVTMPIREGWVAVATAALVDRMEIPSLSALSELVHASGESIRFAAPASFGRDRFSSFLAAYALEGAVGGITWARDLGEAEAMVRLGAADVALLEGLEETLTLAGFPRLTDDAGVLEGPPHAVVLLADLSARHPGIDAILSALASNLTTEALHALNSRVRLLGEDPETVARAFLSAANPRE